MGEGDAAGGEAVEVGGVDVVELQGAEGLVGEVVGEEEEDIGGFGGGSGAGRGPPREEGDDQCEGEVEALFHIKNFRATRSFRP